MVFKPQVNPITITYNTSSLLRHMIFRLTAPNWESPSPYDGSQIIMSISDISLFVSIITFPSHILIPVAQYTCAVFDSSALTDCSRRTLSLYSTTFTAGDVRRAICPWPQSDTGLGSFISWSLVGGRAAPSVFELGHCRRALHLRPAEQFGPQCAGPTTFPS